MTPDQNNTKYRIILAGLLHDIGKFWQRADKKINNGSVVYGYTRNEPLLKHICPDTNKNNNRDYQPGYIHALWTSHFFETNKDIFHKVKQDGRELFRVNVFDRNNEFIEDNITNLASCHHNPHTFNQGIIQLADWWSSGLDRRHAPHSEDDDSVYSQQDQIRYASPRFKKIPLHSIFNLISVNDKIADEVTGYPLTSLDISSTIFPKPITNESVSEDLDYKSLWNDFQDEFKNLPTDSWRGFIHTLLYLLKKYTWSIPSSTPDLPYVSLYEHLKSTAAIAGCLYDYYQENSDGIRQRSNSFSLEVTDGHEPLKLVSIDISGIQDFIYNIASAKAYRSLKGRSFYLTLLLDAVVTKFINKIGHTSANIVYASGGKAFILAPNTNKTCNAIKHLQADIEEKIFAEHQGRLYVSITSIPFAYRFSDREDKNEAIISSGEIPTEPDQVLTLAELWGELIRKADRVKNRRFQSLITDKNKFHEFFSKNGLLGVYSLPEEICAVTGEPITGRKKNLNKNKDTDPIYVLEQVFEQTQLGEVLKDCDYIFKYDKPTGKENQYLSNRVKVHIEPCDLGIHYYLIDESQLADNTAHFRSITSGDGTEVLRLNNTDFLWSGKLKGNDASYGFLLYGGNKQPTSNLKRDDIEDKYYAKTFEELCHYEHSDNKKEETRLGVLRMDVDNLGAVFSSGFKSQYRSFAAYGTLSFMLDLYFSGYLNSIRKNYKDTVTIVYSGGDDVFAVGRWDKLICFGKDIREDFKKFTGHPAMSLSGGMVMVHSKFPISKAADLAGDEEKKAKTGDKDSIVLFGERVKWGEKEFQVVEDMKKQFCELVKKNGLTRGLLHQLQQYKVLKDEGERRLCDGGQKDWSYKWHSAYHLGRYAQRYKKDSKITELIKNISDGIMHNGKPTPDRYLDLVGLAARWAEYELKIKTK